MEIVNTIKDNVFFEGNNIRAKMLGYAIIKDKTFIYYYANRETYIEERINDKFSDSIVKPSELAWISSDSMWDYLYRIGIDNKILGVNVDTG